LRCGKKTPAKRSTKKYCSGKCNQSVFKKKSGLEKREELNNLLMGNKKLNTEIIKLRELNNELKQDLKPTNKKGIIDRIMQLACEHVCIEYAENNIKSLTGKVTLYTVEEKLNSLVREQFVKALTAKSWEIVKE